jgi:hypothetical protein
MAVTCRLSFGSGAENTLPHIEANLAIKTAMFREEEEGGCGDEKSRRKSLLAGAGSWASKR